jgi:hypothetical protein
VPFRQTAVLQTCCLNKLAPTSALEAALHIFVLSNQCMHLTRERCNITCLGLFPNQRACTEIWSDNQQVSVPWGPAVVRSASPLWLVCAYGHQLFSRPLL